MPHHARTLFVLAAFTCTAGCAGDTDDTAPIDDRVDCGGIDPFLVPPSEPEVGQTWSVDGVELSLHPREDDYFDVYQVEDSGSCMWLTPGLLRLDLTGLACDPTRIVAETFAHDGVVVGGYDQDELIEVDRTGEAGIHVYTELEILRGDEGTFSRVDVLSWNGQICAVQIF